MDTWTTLALSRIATGERHRDAARYRAAKLAAASSRGHARHRRT